MYKSQALDSGLAPRRHHGLPGHTLPIGRKRTLARNHRRGVDPATTSEWHLPDCGLVRWRRRPAPPRGAARRANARTFHTRDAHRPVPWPRRSSLGRKDGAIFGRSPTNRCSSDSIGAGRSSVHRQCASPFPPGRRGGGTCQRDAGALANRCLRTLRAQTCTSGSLSTRRPHRRVASRLESPEFQPSPPSCLPTGRPGLGWSSFDAAGIST